jgi:hypothetical protein
MMSSAMRALSAVRRAFCPGAALALGALFAS